MKYLIKASSLELLQKIYSLLSDLDFPKVTMSENCSPFNNHNINTIMINEEGFYGQDFNGIHYSNHKYIFIKNESGMSELLIELGIEVIVNNYEIY